MERWRIRKASISDIGAITRIERESFPDYPYPREVFYFYLRKCQEYFLVAEIDEELIGYVLGCADEDEGSIVSIAISPNHRGKGIGRMLMEAVEKEMKERGVRKIKLEVSNLNFKARRLYEKLGYREISRIRNYYSDGSDAIVMEKIIRST
ncbi:MAG: ribosomal protein S18-alanine N-acetyltransferase [Fervidicoccaceae archaeon]